MFYVLFVYALWNRQQTCFVVPQDYSMRYGCVAKSFLYIHYKKTNTWRTTNYKILFINKLYSKYDKIMVEYWITIICLKDDKINHMPRVKKKKIQSIRVAETLATYNALSVDENDKSIIITYECNVILQFK